ncbi:MAG: hypothetical protein DWQ19_11510 [Crenarchaeota archaeon]|nr:MAG: hypothetical protein DWQ19_11510 [Thermoproteota archaeon]
MSRKEQLFIICILLLVINILVYLKKTDKHPEHVQEDPGLEWLFKPEQEQPKPEPKPEPEPEIEPEWVNYPPLREVTNLGKVLSDIESHMPAGHIYRDSDKITWAHETTHGINSNLRQKYSRSYGGRDVWGRSAWKEIDGKPVFHNGRINGFYCLDNKAAIIEEPPTTMQAAAALVPQSLRGPVYNLYMVQQARSWGDTPLYIFDEWSAYQNGSACRADLEIQERSETVSQMLEFDVYALALAMAVKKQAPNYDDSQFKRFLMWSLDRSFKLYKGESRAQSYLQAWKTSPDAEDLRQFTREYCGQEWTKKVLGF